MYHTVCAAETSVCRGLRSQDAWDLAQTSMSQQTQYEYPFPSRAEQLPVLKRASATSITLEHMRIHDI